MTRRQADPTWRDVGRHFNFYAVWAATGLIDALFLVMWVYAQWLVSKFLSQYQLVGVDLIVLDVFRVLLALSTVGPIAIEIYRHLRIMIIQANRSIGSAR
jgi:hypothetical protein